VWNVNLKVNPNLLLLPIGYKWWVWIKVLVKYPFLISFIYIMVIHKFVSYYIWIQKQDWYQKYINSWITVRSGVLKFLILYIYPTKTRQIPTIILILAQHWYLQFVQGIFVNKKYFLRKNHTLLPFFYICSKIKKKQKKMKITFIMFMLTKKKFKA
jgi:hypothetical protein